MEEFIDPVIEFKEKNRTVKISGVSMMEDALEFYKECKNWIDDYLNSNSDPLIIEFELTYFNSSTAKSAKCSCVCECDPMVTPSALSCLISSQFK